MKCNKCNVEMKTYWDGNPDGNFAQDCPKCRKYIINGQVFKNYADAEKNYVPAITLADRMLGVK
jgi:hypothetical protein